MSRSVGFKKDLRLSKKHNYANYCDFNVKSYLGLNGDCYDRYLIRMLEMAESLNICNSVCNSLLTGDINTNVVYQQLVNKKINIKKTNYTHMEDLIEHFIQ
jgi:NADH-quinone oxidoreductase subunit D